jgi:hypothetical protein
MVAAALIERVLSRLFEVPPPIPAISSPFDVAVLSSVVLIAMIWALIVFPRRDLAAPS